MWWTWEKYVREVLNVGELWQICPESEKTLLEVHWIRKNHVSYVLKVRKICKRCAKCKKTM